MKKTQYIIVFVTVPNQKTASAVMKHVLKKKLCACVNIINNIGSHYWWNGKIEHSKELLLIMKTVNTQYKALEKEIIKNHPYEVPEIISLEIKEGSKDYLDWIKEYAG